MRKKDIYGFIFLGFALLAIWQNDAMNKFEVATGPVPFIKSLPWLASESIFGFLWQQEVMNGQKEAIKRSQIAIPRFYDALRNKSCAVVGSSSNLKGMGYGKLIDQFDVVFRINQAPAGGQYSSDAGSKTTIRIISPKAPAQVANEFDPRSIDKFIILRKRRNYPEGNLKYFLRNDNILFLDMKRIRDILLEDSGGKTDEKAPSSGLTAVYMATETCGEVSIFGFGPDSTGVFGYYYVMQDKKETTFAAHSPILQDAYLSELEKRGAIKIYQGNRKNDN